TTVNTVALYTSDTCSISGGSFMNGQVDETACSSYVTGNTGCGVKMTGGEGAVNGSYGAGFNAGGGGWYAMWRDLKNDYAGATYTSMGCPGTCSNFGKAYPAAFAEAYWCINSLRVYTATGKTVTTTLSGGAIAGIVIGCVAALVLIAFGWWRYTIWKRKRNLKKGSSLDEYGGDVNLMGAHADTFKKLASRKPRIGPTKLAPGKTALSFLEGETPTQVYGRTPRYDHSPSNSDIKLTGASSYYSNHTRSLTPEMRPAGSGSWVG
ncbi:hypothetical protein I315_01793, partial [Cryptococcus gattii Ru294]